MARITKINSLEKALKVAGGQITAQQLLNERMYLKTTGWSKIQLSTDFRDELINTITFEIVGGRAHTKERVYNRLKFENPQHWALDRIFVSKYKNNPARLYYCAGQDATYEIKQLREYLK